MLEKLHCFSILQALSKQASASSRPHLRLEERQKQCARKRKCSKWAGIYARLKDSWLVLQSPLLYNMCSLDNKLDCLRTLMTSWKEIGHHCVLIFTPTWLHEGIADSTIHLDGLTSYRADRHTSKLVKMHRSRLCVHVNNSWCTNAAVQWSRF